MHYNKISQIAWLINNCEKFISHNSVKGCC